ncbi:MAG: hypothetical protein K2L28_10340, partial [Muribaculaceae bacterium]|nr:hypothetical protein [Muribaculaceae bacterium]
HTHLPSSETPHRHTPHRDALTLVKRTPRVATTSRKNHESRGAASFLQPTALAVGQLRLPLSPRGELRSCDATELR